MSPHIFKLQILIRKSSEIDTSFYVLTVDLWNAEGNREVNLVRHSATSPSISTATSSSYPPPPQTLSSGYPTYPQVANPYAQPGYNPYYGTQPTFNPHAGFHYGHGGPQAYYASIAQGYYPGTPTQAMVPQPL